MTSEAEEKALRYRRAQSVTRAEEITEKEKKVRKSQPDKPIHSPRDSLFSWSSEFDNFTGLVNWGFLMLSIGGVRLFLENLIKYGIRVDPIQWLIVLTGKNEGGSEYPSIILLIYTVVPVVICLVLERGISLCIIAVKLGIVAHIANILALVVLPVIVIHYRGQEFSMVGSMTVCMVYLILFLKLWSYVHVNHWCRSRQRESHNKGHLRRQSLSAPTWNQFKINEDEDEQSKEEENMAVQEKSNGEVTSVTLVQYPDNLTLRDLYYFLLAPTLCYELNFPRTSRIRKRFLIKRILEVVLGAHVAIALFQQWMVPSVRNSLVPFSQMDYMRCAERLLKLAVPNHLMWLCFFYLNFHSFLNLMGELMHFADRTFYNDWWNANNIDTFWRTWNMPVHRWAVRHLYIPIVESGYSKNLASMTVFFISAFFHEYLVSVPLQTFKVWAFMGMMAQLPLSSLSRMAERKLGPRTGNLIVWSSIILGQPLAIMMYYHDYMIQHYSLDQLDDM